MPVRNAGSIRTALAIQNVSGNQNTVTITYRSGATEMQTTQVIPVNGRTAQFVDEIFPTLSGDFNGTATITSPDPFAAIALEQGPGVITTLPVTPLP